MTDDTSIIWFGLHERRGSIQNRSEYLKRSSARRKTFAAAMQQFEEQMTAANVVTPATSPLNLYYGLAQAGLAICAAHAPDPWSFSRHGLKLGDTRPDLADISVKPDGTGAFQVVASATGSSVITEPVSIGSLWASLPDLNGNARLPGKPYSPALYVTSDLQSPMVTSWSGNLLTQALYHEPASARIHLQMQMPDASGKEELLQFLMDQYPSLRSWKFDPSGWRDDSAGAIAGLSLRIWLPDSVPENPVPAVAMETIFDTFAPPYRYQFNRYLRPSIEGDGKPTPSPLMSWWLLLYSFSMLARYHPRRWTDLLNLDKRGCASQLHYALQTARSAVPHLILGALDGHSVLLPRPASF